MRTPTFLPPRSDLRAARRVDAVHELRAHGAACGAPAVTSHEPGVALTGRGAQRRRGVSSSAGESVLELCLSCGGIAFALLFATGWPLRWLAQLCEVLQ